MFGRKNDPVIPISPAIPLANLDVLLELAGFGGDHITLFESARKALDQMKSRSEKLTEEADNIVNAAEETYTEAEAKLAEARDRQLAEADIIFSEAENLIDKVTAGNRILAGIPSTNS